MLGEDVKKIENANLFINPKNYVRTALQMFCTNLFYSCFTNVAQCETGEVMLCSCNLTENKVLILEFGDTTGD